MSFKALWVTEVSDGKFERSIVDREIEDLPAGELLVRVHYSSLNYKDAMSATGNKGITRKYPHTPGIDAAGVVEISRSEHFATGDRVVITGNDLGMNTSGGFAEYIRIPASWAVQAPTQYSLSECMAIGTAGFTAALALMKMENLGVIPCDKPVVVTGATGGVGSLAVAILAKAGYEVTAVTGKSEVTEYLQNLGATSIKDRSYVNDESGKNLIRPQWCAAIDTVGGNVLATLLKGCQPEGCIVSTGLVGSAELHTTVYPFILNGVSLLGVGSAGTPLETRKLVWEKLNKEWLIQEKLSSIIKMIGLDELKEHYIESILEGRNIGRVVVSLID